MGASRVIICVVLIVFMCFPIWDASNEGGTRHYNSVTKFQGDIENKILTFMSGGTDSSLAVSLPEDSKMESATVDIEGRVVYVEPEVVKIDYTDTVNNQAWEDTTNMECPVTSPPSNFKTTPFTANDYNDIKTLNGNYKVTMGGGSGAGCPVQLYEFNLSSYTVVEFEVFWVGYYVNWNFANVDGMNISIWNVTGNTWDIVGSHFAPPGTTPPTTININKSYTTNLVNYIDSSTKILYVIVSGPLGIGFSWCDISTDYISINITQSITPSYPNDPYLDIGADGDKDWTFTGKLSTNATFSGDVFIAELQDHVDLGTSVGGMIHIQFVFGMASPGELYISNLTVVIVTNQEPTNLKDIPSINFYEDTGWYETGINLTKYFQDLDDSLLNLSFELYGNTSNIWGVITSEYTLNFTSSTNYFGIAELNILCRDRGFDGITSSDDCIVYSNNFTVTVLPSDDPPVIQYLDDEPVIDNSFFLSAYEDEYLNFTVIAEDIDGDDIKYSINITDEALLLNGNNVTYLPKQEHVGFFNFTITATEINASKLYDFVDIIIEVENMNDAPIIDDIKTPIVVDEDVWVNFTVSAEDVDLFYDPDEKLKFSTNFSDNSIATALWNFDEDTGKFSFLPNNSLVGRYYINFSIEDNYGEKDWCLTIIWVNNVNDPPIAKPIAFTIVDADETTPELENLTVTFTTEPATDHDFVHGDVLTYSWDFDASDGISIDATSLTVEWTYLVPGNYTVTLTVRDSGFPIMINSTSIIIQILAPKEYPSEENGTHEEEETGDEKGTVNWVWITLGVIVLIIVFGIIAGFIIMMKRREILEAQQELAALNVMSQPISYPSGTVPAPTAVPVAQPSVAQGIKSQVIQPFSYSQVRVQPMEIAKLSTATQVQLEPAMQQPSTTVTSSLATPVEGQSVQDTLKNQQINNH